MITTCCWSFCKLQHYHPHNITSKIKFHLFHASMQIIQNNLMNLSKVQARANNTGYCALLSNASCFLKLSMWPAPKHLVKTRSKIRFYIISTRQSPCSSHLTICKCHSKLLGGRAVNDKLIFFLHIINNFSQVSKLCQNLSSNRSKENGFCIRVGKIEMH